MCFHPFPALQSHFPGTHRLPGQPTDAPTRPLVQAPDHHRQGRGHGSPAALSPTTLQHLKSAKQGKGFSPGPFLCDGCRAPCPKLGFPSHLEKDPHPWAGLIPRGLGEVSEGIIPPRGGGASRRTNHHPREPSRWVLNGLAGWKRTETKVRVRDSIVDSPQALPLTLS